jgi:hypothetical protein
MITIKCQIGKNVIEVTEDTAKKAIEEIAFFQNIPSECPECQSPVKFTFRTPQSYTYYGLECTGQDHHAVNFGQNKEGGSLFYKHDKWTSFKDRNSASQEPPWEN